MLLRMPWPYPLVHEFLELRRVCLGHGDGGDGEEEVEEVGEVAANVGVCFGCCRRFFEAQVVDVLDC